MTTTTIVIGAGIAGLSAGCYGQMNGYRTRVFEMGEHAGGCCTAWRRHGYTVDACVHWLIGSGADSPFSRLWREVGVLQDLTIVDHDAYARVEASDGRELVLWADIERLREHLTALAPEDAGSIDALVKAVRTCGRLPMIVDRPPELMGLGDGLKMMATMVPLMPFLSRWKKLTFARFVGELKNPFLRESFGALRVAFGDNLELPMLAVAMTLSMLHRKTAGYPLGGSLPVTEAMERRYLDLGGEVHYGSAVERVLVKDGRAVGIRLADGTEHEADTVISAADGHTTIFGLLGGRYVSEDVVRRYRQRRLVSPLLQVAVGVDRRFEDVPPSVAGLTFALERSTEIGGRPWKWLTVQPYSFDPGLAPEGKTSVKVILNADYDHWRALWERPEEYRAAKDWVAETVIAALDTRFPGLAGRVEMVDVATPVSFERFTGNWRGSYMGWRSTADTFGARIGKTLPDLDRFYMAGQWVEPGGGLPTVLMSGRNVTQLLCRRDGRQFVTSEP